VTQRNNYRGYDATPAVKNSAVQQQHREAVKTQIQHPTAQQQQRREQFQAATPEQRQQKLNNLHANALSGNDIRSPPGSLSRSAACRAAISRV
jgi:Spy/CpxP family protein refolding chaperone